MKKLLSVTIIALCLNGCTSMGVRFYEQADYEIVDKQETVEIREYHDIIVAETLVPGTYNEAYPIAFEKLSSFIAGDNVKRGFKRTSTATSLGAPNEIITMRIPIIVEKREFGWNIAFVMPTSYTMRSIPVPKDKSIRIRKIDSKRVASIRYGGMPTLERMEEEKHHLLAWLEKRHYKVQSGLRMAMYDTGETISPMFRRNEIHVDVE